MTDSPYINEARALTIGEHRALAARLNHPVSSPPDHRASPGEPPGCGSPEPYRTPRSRGEQLA